MSTRTAFRTRITDLPIADGPSGQHVVWATVYFYPEEARINNLDLIRLMMYRVVNRQVTVDELPMHHRYSHCLSIRVAGELPDEDAVHEVAEAMLDYFYGKVKSGELVINRTYIFRRRSRDLLPEKVTMVSI
ncbi:hypothetical protein N7489_003972 [Penicillium chrysogenum]|uniref:Uncharacterized protein n=1 Tax=Penicillium rubens (strain ATCC 28089 / DSM 1075 / NRRL 1951 / Wisconsin 54-1255) TaxID=500485 RepID=B6H9C9_PENRW|nr:uncharacterized protein N7489_003972 [Penicillium chrysogenum]KAJ5243876.1 hypothetical protein N7489_003972 [Penicillium chrysogenum]KAJ6163695.1 hypothetical protein N7497_003674 [Penicillium chrysogenum]CAP93314.1 hypothetical protein PCH_Pc16g06440 [Penicillium rubens Wisconsin 54-1255]